MEKEIIKYHFFDDLGFVVISKTESHNICFTVYRSFYDGLQRTFEKDCNPVFKIEDADIYLRGNVKCDGCSNWNFDEQDRGVMLHACERKQLVNLGLIMAKCYDLASELCPNWLGD